MRYDEAWSRHLAWASATAQQLEGRIGSEVEWEAEFDAVEDDLRFALASAPSGRDQTDDAAYVLALACGHLTYAAALPRGSTGVLRSSRGSGAR